MQKASYHPPASEDTSGEVSTKPIRSEAEPFDLDAVDADLIRMLLAAYPRKDAPPAARKGPAGQPSLVEQDKVA